MNAMIADNTRTTTGAATQRGRHYRTRLRLIQATRRFFDARGYLETDTPLLSPRSIPESVIPLFSTQFEHPFLGTTPMYLLPSPELWMKRLLADGWGDIFQLCHAFRNAENVGMNHSPEFTILEYYTVGVDYLGSIAVTEALFSALAATVGRYSDGLAVPFRRMTMAEAFALTAGQDLAAAADPQLTDTDALAAIRALAERAAVGTAIDDDWETLFNRVFVSRVEPNLPRDRPLVLMDYPWRVPTLARRLGNTAWCERWELYVNGIELANCFSEETDAQRVRDFYTREIAAIGRAAIGRAATPALKTVDDRYDFALIDSIAAGLPACSGVAMGFDRLVMAFSGATDIRDTQLFSPWPAMD